MLQTLVEPTPIINHVDILGHTCNFVHYLVLCIVYFVLFYVLFVCKCVLPPGDNPIAVNKYIISYIISSMKSITRLNNSSVPYTEA